ncbi:hypothetical protein PHJA_000075700 [Phtheirospermum japonicum]|uniref:Uncharacterized protein n=1 Tax=Phtheirospermum japonicum TaxID=374723 RepID=A0A830B1K2_9LAMI|nr:hypothetical protein PHJA_000075700 [Phtheirospermum japonicum]
MINLSYVHYQTLLFLMMEEYGRKECRQAYKLGLTWRSRKSKLRLNPRHPEQNLGPATELFCHQNLKWMLNRRIDDAIPRSSKASMVHPWLTLPPPLGFFPICRRGGAAAEENDQKQEKEIEHGFKMHLLFVCFLT